MQKVNQRIGISTDHYPGALQALLKDSAIANWKEGVAMVSFEKRSVGLEANREYFDNLYRTSNYLEYVHRVNNFAVAGRLQSYHGRAKYL